MSDYGSNIRDYLGKSLPGGAATGALSGALAGGGSAVAAGLSPKRIAGAAIAGAGLGGGYGAMTGADNARKERGAAGAQASQKYQMALGLARERRLAAVARERIESMHRKHGSSLMDRLNKAKGIVKSVGSAVAPAAEKAAPVLAKAVEKATPEAGSLWRSLVSKAKPKAHFLGKGKIVTSSDRRSMLDLERPEYGGYSGYQYSKSLEKGAMAEDSLTKIAADLYAAGAVRPNVMEHAVKQAAHIKTEEMLEQSIKTAQRRRALFGATSPTLEKVAIELKPFQEAAIHGFGLATGAMGAAGLGMLAEEGYHYIMNKGEKNTEQSYQEMMQANPDFMHNEAVVRSHFDVLKKFAPSVASDPTVAAGHVRQAIEMGHMIPVDTVKNLVQTQKLHQEAGTRNYVLKK